MNGAQDVAAYRMDKCEDDQEHVAHEGSKNLGQPAQKTKEGKL